MNNRQKKDMSRFLKFKIFIFVTGHSIRWNDNSYDFFPTWEGNLKTTLTFFHCLKYIRVCVILAKQRRIWMISMNVRGHSVCLADGLQTRTFAFYEIPLLFLSFYISFFLPLLHFILWLSNSLFCWQNWRQSTSIGVRCERKDIYCYPSPSIGTSPRVLKKPISMVINLNVHQIKYFDLLGFCCDYGINCTTGIHQQYPWTTIKCKKLCRCSENGRIWSVIY